MTEKFPADIMKAAIEAHEAQMKADIEDEPLIIARYLLAERQRCAEAYMHWARKLSSSATVEIDDGSLIVRFGQMSITVFSETATLYDTSKPIPAKKVSLSRDEFFKEAEPFLADQPAKRMQEAMEKEE